MTLEELTPLERAIVAVESGGKLDAIGDNGRSFGPFQIQQIYCDDVNRVFGTSHKAKDCTGNLGLSVDIFRKYMSIWATPKRTGVLKGGVTDEMIARTHNGGPRGWCKKATTQYWEKVRGELKKI